MFDLRMITMNANQAKELSEEMAKKRKRKEEKKERRAAKKMVRKINRAIIQGIKAGRTSVVVEIAKEGEELHREYIKQHFSSKGYNITISTGRVFNPCGPDYYRGMAEISW